MYSMLVIINITVTHIKMYLQKIHNFSINKYHYKSLQTLQEKGVISVSNIRIEIFLVSCIFISVVLSRSGCLTNDAICV